VIELQTGAAGYARRRMKPTVDVDRARAASFVLDDELAPFASEWHRHKRHQVLYSRRGALRLQVGGVQWLVPPQRAAWLAAGTPHRVWATTPVSLRTAYLAGRLGGGLDGCRVFELPAVGREMLEYGARWGPDGSPKDRKAAAYFAVLAELCREWASQPSRLSLPAAKTEAIERAMRLTLEGIDRRRGDGDDDGERGSLAEVARRVGMSTRTLQRQFHAETGSSWRTFLMQARMLRALELLAAPGARVTEVAMRLGFTSFGAFSRAFSRLAGETPRDYARRSR
jgi:AraC-like DNA-binding protein/mannose-6-phosphate isomerase-like protein (cupin superfamily)